MSLERSTDTERTDEDKQKLTMPQAKTVVPQLLNVVGVALILMWVGFIALLGMHGKYQFFAIMIIISVFAVLVIARNEI